MLVILQHKKHITKPQCSL